MFLDIEDGTSELNVRRIGISSFEGFEATWSTLFDHHQGVETLVVDPVDALRLSCEFAALAPLFANAPTSPIAKPIPRPTVDPVIELPTPSTDGPELEAAGELSIQERLKQALFGIHEDWITEFLINRQKIAIGQSILDAPHDELHLILPRLSKPVPRSACQEPVF